MSDRDAATTTEGTPQRRVLLTGAAGFVGFYVATRMLDEGDAVVGLDSFDATVYPAEMKRERAAKLASREGFTLHEAPLEATDLDRLIGDARPDVVVHLAALANPRTSVRLPPAYVAANVAGTVALLEAMRKAEVRKLVVASSSTVYGADQSYPWREDLPCDRPLNPYAASKRATELFAHSYHVTAGFDVFALRFFTAYGPWGRTDMGWYQMMQSVLERRRFTLFDGGRPRRDFTFVEDVASGVVAAARRVAGYEIINLGRGEPVAMRDFVAVLEELTGRPAIFDDAPLPPSDGPITYADISKARQLLDYDPKTPLREGLRRLVEWYVEYSGLQPVPRG
jgi:UDP-glucuronate 4-epimerase